ncbi:hypothetical protein CAEBREN_02942 [Caenorhabditis brenneri]|uniref:Seven TM Receptor n=1 Tax=Caenorhabditis brenneri TaxID=135651 RepID=G0P2B4_CAEBE|nr:hypothetical protein CAEBREN_02942 [Caenorhabditis brenneri]
MTEKLRTILSGILELDVDRIVYAGCFYWKTDEYGNKNLNWNGISGIFALNLMMSIGFLIVIFFGSRSYKKIKALISQGESDYSRRLQTQLYHALVAQTLIPVIFLFFPVGVYFICPLFGWSIEYGSLTFTFLNALYPAVDPIPIIFLIDDYRNAFLNFFRRMFKKNQLVSVVSYEPNTASF